MQDPMERGPDETTRAHAVRYRRMLRVGIGTIIERVEPARDGARLLEIGAFGYPSKCAA